MENPELPKIEIEIPSQLKLKLEDDCYFIKRKKKVGGLHVNVSIKYVISFVLLVFPWFQLHVKVVLNMKFGLREQLFVLVVCCSI